MFYAICPFVRNNSVKKSVHSKLKELISGPPGNLVSTYSRCQCCHGYGNSQGILMGIGMVWVWGLWWILKGRLYYNFHISHSVTVL